MVAGPRTRAPPRDAAAEIGPPALARRARPAGADRPTESGHSTPLFPILSGVY